MICTTMAASSGRTAGGVPSRIDRTQLWACRSYTDPSSSGRGNAFSGKKEYDKAIADFTKAIEIDPNYALAYFGRGLAYKLTANRTWAIDDLSKCIELTNDQSLIQLAKYELQGVLVHPE